MLRSLWLWLKRLTFLFWILFMVVLGAALAVDNLELVKLKIFGLGFPQTSLGLVVCVSLLTGALLGFFTNYLMMKPRQVANRRALKKATKEVANLQANQAVE